MKSDSESDCVNGYCANCGNKVVPLKINELIEVLRRVIQEEIYKVNTRSKKSDIPKLLTLSEVISLTGCSRSLIYLRMTEGSFPRPIKTGMRKVRWLEEHIYQWLEKLKRRRVKP